MRDEWKFAYTADKVLAGAEGKAGFHRGRLQWWTDKRETVMAQVRAEGIEIDESLAERVGTASNNVNYARQPSVHIRADLQRDLQECTGKMQEHRHKAEAYEAWVQVLSPQGKSSLDLDQSGWLYFFGK